jgi:hemin uptake protein HemP
MSIRNLISHSTILCFLMATVTVHAQSVNPPSMTKLGKPIEIVTSQDIRDPDRYLLTRHE